MKNIERNMSSVRPKYKLIKNGKKILIRTAMAKDANELRNFMFNVSKERIFTIVEPEEYIETAKSYRSKIKKYKSAAGKLYLIAQFRKTIIGLIQFDNFNYKKSAHAGYLAIYIKKGWRNIGIGKTLIEELLKWAENSELIEKVALNVFSTNTNAITLYRKMGFKQEGRCPKDMKINGEYVDSILMYKFTE